MYCRNVPNIVRSVVAISSSTCRRLDLRFSPSFPSHAHSKPHMSVLPIPIKDVAVQNNQRIFSTYEVSLSDTTHYIEFAGKFALWLDSDRAYYPQGKPSIVSILMTAYRTVHRTICPQHDIHNATLLNTDPYKNHPLMFAYRHLIEVLSKYVKHFLDDAVLRPQVQFLLHTVGMHLNTDTRPRISVQPSPIVQRPPPPVQTEQQSPRASTSRAGSSQSPAPLSLPKKKKRNFDLLIKQDLDCGHRNETCSCICSSRNGACPTKWIDIDIYIWIGCHASG
ncbi:hypothetical protein IW262DRAFT_587507 [Armillaria fumosa]|nr:hypothetical protein IW262DRAFT_587507 [Armillaria fumosa]